jgi:hypothetical protein
MGVFRCNAVRSGPTQYACKQKGDEIFSITKRRCDAWRLLCPLNCGQVTWSARRGKPTEFIQGLSRQKTAEGLPEESRASVPG